MKKRREQVATLIGPLCMQLRTMAIEAKLETLAFLLEMASLEASRLQLDILQAKTKQMRRPSKTSPRTGKRKRRTTTASAA